MASIFRPSLLLPVSVSVLLILLASCAPEPRLCEWDVKVCPDGTTVSRAGLDCSFPACPSAPLKTGKCLPAQKGAEYCVEVYDPVCGSDGKNYGNSCFACRTGIESWTQGRCRTG